jgi:hypothetical protein
VINEAAFNGNDRIQLIIISSVVSDIGEGAFSYCTALEDIQVASESEYYMSTRETLNDRVNVVLYNKYQTTLHTYLYTNVIDDNDYLYIVDNGANLEIDNVKVIGARAFEGTQVARLRLPSSLITIHDRAFADMLYLEYIYFESSVDNMVREINAFTEDILGISYMTDEEREAFGDRKIIAYGPNGTDPKSLSSYEEKYSTIHRYFIELYFEGDIPEDMLSSDDWYGGAELMAKYNPWTDARDFVIECEITDQANGLGVATITGMTTTPGISTLEMGTEDIVIPLYVRQPDPEDDTKTIKYIVKNIAEGALGNHTEINSVTLLYYIEEIEDAFIKGSTNIVEVIIRDNDYYEVEDANTIVFNKDSANRKLVAYLAKKPQNKYIIPSDVKFIAAGAFSGAKYLTTIVIPRSVIFIGEGAFGLTAKLSNLTVNTPYYSFDNYALYGGENNTLLHTYLSLGQGVPVSTLFPNVWTKLMRMRSRATDISLK